MSYTGEGGLADIKRRIYREHGSVVLGQDGVATITFTQPVDVAELSHIQLTAWVPSGAPIVVNPTAWVEANGLRTGVTIRGDRLRSLPSSIPLASTLASFQPWFQNDAAGANVDWMLY